MATTNLTTEEFENTVLGDGIVLVDWWADWCGPCKAFAPIYESASNENPDITFAKIDTEVEQQLSASAGISSIPTLMAFRDGVLVFAQPGALPAPALDQVIEAVRGLDMDLVHAQVAAQADGSQPPRDSAAD
jgi:thioredoxin 1